MRTESVSTAFCSSLDDPVTPPSRARVNERLAPSGQAVAAINRRAAVSACFAGKLRFTESLRAAGIDCRGGYARRSAMMSSSEQRRRWRSARTHRQARQIVLGPLPNMRENPLDQRRVFDARDDLDSPTAAPTALDLDREHAFEPLHPAHRHMRGRRSLFSLMGARPRPAGVIAARSAAFGANTP